MYESQLEDRIKGLFDIKDDVFLLIAIDLVLKYKSKARRAWGLKGAQIPKGLNPREAQNTRGSKEYSVGIFHFMENFFDNSGFLKTVP